MLLLLGSTGYLGHAFSAELSRRRIEFHALTRAEFDYTQFNRLFAFVRAHRPEFIINAAGYPGIPNVDACEFAREEAMHANMVLPQQIAQISRLTNIPWGHISSGCIYSGAKIVDNGHARIERDFSSAELARRFKSHPHTLRGFSETDESNFSFLCPPCNFYSGTKVLAEQAIHPDDSCYLWRPGLPFSNRDHPRNLLSKLQHYPKVYAQLISGSHIADFASACLDLWQMHAPFGTYNIANPGFINTTDIVEKIRSVLRVNRAFDFFNTDEELYQLAAKEPRSTSILDGAKLLAAGVKLRPIEEAIDAALRDWQTADRPFAITGTTPGLKLEYR